MLVLGVTAAFVLGACTTSTPVPAVPSKEAVTAASPALALPAPKPLRVVTYNVGGAVLGPTPPELVVGVLEGTPRADIYVLQEIWSREHLGGIAEAILGEMMRGSAEVQECPPAFDIAYAPSLRIGILSATPLSDCRVFHPSAASAKYGAFRCEPTVSLPGAQAASSRHGAPGLAVVGIHLDPIEKERDESGLVRMGFVRSARAVLREALTSTSRSRAVREIESWLATWDNERLIVAGDFNTVPFTRTIRHMNRHFDEALRGTGNYLGGTYWKVDGRILPRIDFIFYAGALKRIEARIIEEKAGDHYPVEAQFMLR